MNSIDSNLQNTVWNRVMSGCGESECTQCAQHTQCAQDTRQDSMQTGDLLDMMQGEKNDSAVYRYLSSRVSGRDSRTFLSMAEDKACHFRKLQTQYFLMTGECAQIRAERPNCVSCLTDELRIRYHEEMKVVDWYEDAAKRWPDMKDAFCCMAEKARQHVCAIREMLDRRL